jgi:glycosyltransferase involved in cell wall biosynthesis
MRVLYIVSLYPCWSETFIVRELRELMARGVEVRILSLKLPHEALLQSDARLLKAHVIYPGTFGQSAANVVRSIWRTPWKSLRCLGWILGGFGVNLGGLLKSAVVWWRSLGVLDRIEAWRPHLIHAHWATYPSTSALLLSEVLRVPYSFTAHAHDIFLEQHLLGRKLRTVAFAVTISEFNRGFLGERIGADVRDKLRVVHCGIDIENTSYRESGRDPELILAVGRLDEIKGFPVLVDACRQLRDRGVRFRCDIFGEGPLRPVLERLIESHGLETQVRLRGAQPQEEVRKQLYAAGIFVLPSVITRRGNMDGIPVALMEAMACGAPVVSTTVSGIPELVKNALSGYLVPPNDPHALADKIADLLGDQAVRASFARNARRVVEEQFSVSIESGKLLRLFQTAVGAN